MLADAVVEARKLGAEIKYGTVYMCLRQPSGNKCYLFEYNNGGDKCFSEEVWASNAYHARALGWEAWVARETRRQKYPIEWVLTYALSHESYGGYDHKDGNVSIRVKAASRTEAIKLGVAKMRRTNPTYEAKLTDCSSIA